MDKVKKICDDILVAPEEYMTSEEFRIESRKDIDEICKKQGVFQL